MNTATSATFYKPEGAIVESIRRYFREDRSHTTVAAARRFAVPEQAVLDALVGEWPVRPLRPKSLRDVVYGLPGLGRLRVFARNRALVLEAEGTVLASSESGPILNVRAAGFDLHLTSEDVVAIYAFEKPVQDGGTDSQGLFLFDRAGDAVLKVFLWENHPHLPADRVAAFEELASRLAVEAPAHRESAAFTPLPERPAIPVRQAEPLPPIVTPEAAPAPVPVPLPEGVMPGLPTLQNAVLGQATSDDPTAAEPIPWQARAIRIGGWAAAILSVTVVGLLLVTVFIMPLFWRHYEGHPGLQDAPKLALTPDNISDLPINVGFACGTASYPKNFADLFVALLEAGWNPADTATYQESRNVPPALLASRPYPRIDHVEPRYLFGKPQELSFEREVSGTRRLLRLWRADTYALAGRNLWVGSVCAVREKTQGDRVASKLQPGLDTARDGLIDDLAQALRLTEVFRVTGVGPRLWGADAGGSSYYTDGEVSIGIIPPYGKPHDRAPSRVESPALVRLKDSIWSELAPVLAGESGG